MRTEEEEPNRWAPHKTDSTTAGDVLRILIDNGLDGMAWALEALINAAMKLERAEFLGVAPHQRTDDRRGYANGLKPRRLLTRSGAQQLCVPQMRDAKEPFHQRSLERGARRERALTLAIAEMYAHGVSTRRIAAVTATLCGTP